MTMMQRASGCAEVLDDLGAIVDGDEEALRRHAEHLGQCDRCRDARYEAAAAAELVRAAGADFVSSEGFMDNVLAKADAMAPPTKVQTSPAPAPSSPKPAPTAGANQPEGKQVGSEVAAASKSAGPAAEPRRSNVRWLWRVGGLAAAATIAGAVALGSGVLSDRSGSPVQPQSLASLPTAARLARVVGALASASSGVEIRLPGAGVFSAATAGASLPAGSAVRTDARTRARLELSDGSVVALDHATEMRLDAATPRLVHIDAGEIVADVAHLASGPLAVFATPTGRVEVLGTKFALSVSSEQSSVRVTRGSVRIVGAAGNASVAAGQEGLLPKSAALEVSPAVDLASSVAWSELGITGDSVEASHAGLGELRARRPGQSDDQPLQLASHKVSVRIMGNMARTEIEEVFSNDSGHTLEGIYRFPLPPEGRIARLALDVDGRLEEGAFVERDRAAQIWGGVIRNATPVPEREVTQEFIWVPGPWRDPALLEWKRGGRFELRIFPIPAHGQRRVILAYTETLQPRRDGRRYVYPLPQSADASTRVGHFEADIRVAGTDPELPIVTHGYTMRASQEQNATRLAFAQESFLPIGDMIIDFAPAGRRAELTAWTYAGPTMVPAVSSPRRADGPGGAVAAAEQALASDARQFVAFAIRPELPARTETRERDYVVVVDSSQSMIGERFTRATRLAASIVAEMDRRARIQVLACDVACRSMSELPQPTSAHAAAELSGWLASIRPAGASDLVGALSAAAHSMDGKRSNTRDLHVIYIGDGMASVGHRRPAALSAETQAIARDARVAFTTVGVGADADTMALSAIARAGGGHYVPFVPGVQTNAAALAVLETTYGVTLVDPVLELPNGIEEVAPARLPNIRAGEEVMVVGRLSGPVQGEVVLRGTVAGLPYMDRYPVSAEVSSSEGNSFVPQLWAAKTIERLELGGRGEDQARIVALSKRFGVLSRHTSLLVLESEAMFRAFGVDRTPAVAQWTGEAEMSATESMGTEAQEGAEGGMGELASTGLGLAGGGVRSDDSASGSMRRGAPAESRAQPMGRASMAAEQPAAAPMDNDFGSGTREMPRGPGFWMRRVWVRVGQVQGMGSLPGADSPAVLRAEAALRERPESRDRHKELVKALSRAGELERATEVAEKWLGRDPLDAEALTAVSDLVARQGRRDEALRLLSGIVDLDPDSKALQERMASALERSGDLARACSHRVALAEIEIGDSQAVGAAIRCERSRARYDSASRLLQALPDQSARTRAETAATAPASPPTFGGDITVEANWEGGSDLDVSLVTPQGTRVSWMGGRPRIAADGIRSSGGERLALRRAQVGDYVVEVSRTDPTDTRPVSGRVQVQVLGTRRTLAFQLQDDHVAIGRAAVRREARMERF